MVDNHGIMSLETLEELIMKKERLLYLQKHNNKIWQGSDGKWRTYVKSDGSRKLIKRNSLQDIEDYLAEYYRANEYNPTIKELFEEWAEYKLSLGEIKRATYDRYFDDYNRFLANSELRLRHVKTVSEDDIEGFIRSEIAKGMPQRAYANLRTVIIGIFKYAKKQKLTEISISTFFKDLDISKRAFTKTKVNLDTAVFKENEIEKLLDWLYSNPSIENYGLILAFQTGVRCGELAALKFEDVKNDILHVQRQEILYKKTKGEQQHEVVEYTKTASGDRYIYLPKQSVTLLTAIRWLNRDSEYIFAKDGKRINKTCFNNYLIKACKGAGIPPRTMHKIRRTYATTLIDNNVEDSLIMSQMGHSSIETTRKCYYYANKDNEHKRTQIQSSIKF